MALHQSLEAAVKLGLILRNPADAVTPPRFQRAEIHVMDEDDVHSFLEAAKSTPYYALFYTSLFTGMRRSEILALRWCDVDLTMCELSVTRTLHHLLDGRMVFRAPKTAKGRRLIALSPSTALVLKELKEKAKAEHILMGTVLKDSDLVFSYVNGEPLLPDSISQAWRRLAKHLGLSGIRLHDARHTHASLMLKQGIHPKIVQERLGHASIQITLDTYSHVAPGLQKAAAIKFDELLNNSALNDMEKTSNKIP